MSSEFYPFPSTPHFIPTDSLDIRSDKVLSVLERMEFLKHEMVIEEKVDGANLGISFDSSGSIRLQNRGEYLIEPYAGQWKKLPEWLKWKVDLFFDGLHDQYILFGEWCYAQHSIQYELLPDWFLGFDVYDKSSRRFLSTTSRDELFQKMNISQTPGIKTGKFTEIELVECLNQSSRITSNVMEGIYLRVDEGNFLKYRAKIVRSGFLQNISAHWSKQAIKPNSLVSAERINY